METVLLAVSLVPAVVAVVVLSLQALRLAIPWRPQWTRPFVPEVVEPPPETELIPSRRYHQFVPFLLVISAAGLIIQGLSAVESWPETIYTIPTISWLITTGFLVVFRPRTVPFPVFTILILQAASQMTLFAADWRVLGGNQRTYGIVTLVLSLLGAILILFMPLRDPNLPAKDISQPMTEATSSLRSPEEKLSLWQFMTVSWITPLLRTGYRRQLEDEDVWQLAYEFQHQRLHDNFRVLRGTVVSRLIKANSIDLSILTFLAPLEIATQYSMPILLQRLLSSMEDPEAPKSDAINYAALSLAAGLISAQSGVFSLWYGRRCYERSRGEMITMLYEKTLGRKISFAPPEKVESQEANGENTSNGMNGHSPKQRAKPGWKQAWNKVKSAFGPTKPSTLKEPASMGKILNLMRNDVYEVAQRFWEIQDVIKKPLSVVFSVTLVVRFLGWPSMIAVLALFLAQALNFILVRIMMHFERKRRVATDAKLQVISQFVESIRHLRWYGWEGTWLAQIMSARQRELNLRVVTALWRLATAFVNTLALDFTPVIAFFAYTVIAGKPLRVDIAFPALQLFSMMTSALRDLPNLIVVLVNAYVAVGRIEDFMAEPNKEDSSTEGVVGPILALHNTSFAWPGSQYPVLKDVNIMFPTGVTVVFGEVASGKTALLHALLGELDILRGQLIRPQESIGYCAQSPWLQSMSIRDNILFSAPYDESRYKAVIDACALASDLAGFEAGDLSMTGENGIGLSGGQRARIALARAVYSQAKILLLDDPLSALDQQTAETISRECLAGPLLRGRTVVLVTHRTDLVSNFAKQLIEMDNGTTTVMDRGAGYAHLHRVTSTKSEGETDQAVLDRNKALAVPRKFIQDEHRAEGGVKASVYWDYIKAGKLKWWALLVIVVLSYRLITIAEAWFLKAWGEAYNDTPTRSLIFQITDAIKTTSTPLDSLPPPDVNIRPWLLTFLVIALAETCSYILYHGVLIFLTYTAGKRMFKTVMEKFAGATFYFYDTVPIGRLMNRMTSDIGVIDGNINMQLQAVVWLGIGWVSSIVVIASVTPLFLAFAILLTISFVMIFLRFIPASQSLRRLEMVSLTPLMSNFGALLNGLMTVRAFRAQAEFQDRVIRVVDTFQKMDHFYWSLQAWLSYRYEILSATSNFLITLLALYTNVSAGLMAFVLIAANKMVQATHALCRQYGQLQMEFVSVERVVELAHLDQEPKGSVTPAAWWPLPSSDIEFENVTIRYAPDLPPALKGVTFTIKGGSKTAIIGRTGSGKSTLALAILATVIPEVGRISIGLEDLAEVDKQLLRTRVTFLAQDPVLFPGTMRQNLDPIDEHSDEDCELVLHQVCSRQDWELNTEITAGGRNLSQGQRQLVGLARAVLRRSAIIILDEATASIDRETARQIQQVMHDEMRQSTVITIAHRLEAVKHADYCIVLGKGQVLQQGPAAEMLRSHRRDMVENADEE